MQKYSDEVRSAARRLYLKRWTPKEISAELGLPNSRIIYYWAEKESWHERLTENGVEESIALRIETLTNRQSKNDQDLKELDLLISHHVKLLAQRSKHEEKLAKATSQTTATASGDDERPRSKGKRSSRNDVSNISEEDFAKFHETLFTYQLHLRANKHRKTRNLLKSRQIGATYYFAFEAFEDAVITGEPQIFLSASKRQAEVFRSYIVNIAQKFFGVELKGNPIRLSNGAELHFLATNSNTAQSNSGHVYADEYFWIPRFNKFNDVASAMATHDRWRLTYFSTPSSKAHEAYPFWTGESWKKGKADRRHIEFPSKADLRDGGRLCPDQQWRYVVTMEDAIAGGFSFVDIKKLRERYSASAFDMLFMCEFIDDKDAVFKFSDLEKCGVDASRWQDYDPKSERPFGDREVWAGYDPSRTIDNASFALIAPPLAEGERFRVLRRWSWQGMSFKYQAQQIREIYERHNVKFIGIDTTGAGRGVYELVEAFASRHVHAIHYSVETKNRLVLKMIDSIQGRIEWDQEDKEIAASFMSIRQTTTASGNSLTFVADRTAEAGHADAFWAIAHAMSNEPLNTTKRRSKWVKK